MAVLSGPQVGAVLKGAGFAGNDLVIAIAIAKAESGWRTDATNHNTNGSTDYGLMQINSIHHWPGNLFDPANNARAAMSIFRSSGWRAWSTFKNGAYLRYMNEARSAAAGAGNVTGPIGADAGGGGGGITYGAPGPQIVVAGPAITLAAELDRPGPLSVFKFTGGKLSQTYQEQVVGTIDYEQGVSTIPNLELRIVDPDGVLYKQLDPLWYRGTTVMYLDMEMTVNEVKFDGGDAGTGEIAIKLIDSIVYRLEALKGPRTASGISATEWLAQECKLAGMDPNKMFLGESVPSQSTIVRQVDAAPAPINPPVANTTAVPASLGGPPKITPDLRSEGKDDTPSGWSTGQTLAKELGKRQFVTGKRLVFGSAGFALTWCRSLTDQEFLGWNAYSPGDPRRFLTMPEVTRVAVGKTEGVITVKGKILNSRAAYLRSGSACFLRGVPGIADAAYMVSKIKHSLGVDVDGAEIELLQPVDAPPEPPQTAGGDGAATTAGGGADGQIDTFVNLALQQAGDRYIFGVEANLNDPNPSAFDCSELVEWAAWRAGIRPKVPDGSAAQKSYCKPISVQSGIHTKGALLFHPGHVAISLGNGKTIEAYTTGKPVGSLNAAGRFNAAGLIPGATGYRVNA